MSIAEKIEAVLREHTGHKMSVRELAAAIPGSTRPNIWVVCTRLRDIGHLGRTGGNTPGSPYRFYLKNRGDPPLSA